MALAPATQASWLVQGRVTTYSEGRPIGQAGPRCHGPYPEVCLGPPRRPWAERRRRRQGQWSSWAPLRAAGVDAVVPCHRWASPQKGALDGLVRGSWWSARVSMFVGGGAPRNDEERAAGLAGQLHRGTTEDQSTKRPVAGLPVGVGGVLRAFATSGCIVSPIPSGSRVVRGSS
jgi:hypothetical protein